MKKILTLSVEETLVNQAKTLGLNISRFLQTKLIEFIQLNSGEGVKSNGLYSISGGCRARSKVTDLGSVPAGVRRFESGPPHAELKPYFHIIQK